MQPTIVTYLKPSSSPKIVVLNGVTAVGKSTLFKNAFQRPQFKDMFGFSVSHTTRKPRFNEVDGIDYHFVSEEEFEELAQAGAFLEHTRNHGNRYGTSFKALEEVLKTKNVLLDLDYKGAVSLKQAQLKQKQLYVLIRPPTWEAFIERLRKRGTETEEEIQRRLQTAVQETDFFDSNRGFYDVEIVNHMLDSAVEHFCGLLEGFIVQ
ncbi:Guanylate_kinase [Hexamita inflata]|uniref:guanylate kinase n=1 Tax=Hexamita inflata TaxID=28002 RepID=A0AA86QND9_9EUKA|nr:Guanylate kinase [Hexamita inflata]CAI9970823.1 Guanylate kinase [Hexamita inflata]